jgi:hypothetical protein
MSKFICGRCYSVADLVAHYRYECHFDYLCSALSSLQRRTLEAALLPAFCSGHWSGSSRVALAEYLADIVQCCPSLMDRLLTEIDNLHIMEELSQ